jgi:hypothetical protein
MVRKIFAIALLAPLIVACAPFAAPPTPTQAPEQASLVQATCDHVMGLTHSGVYRDLCRESLSQSLARKLEAEAMAGAYGDCRHQGLSEGSAAFSACMLDRQAQSPTVVTRTASLATASLAYDTNAPENTKGYFSVSNTVHWRREQYSCAQLGLTPGTGAFGQCVASLDAALLPDPD